jgi:NADPH:quinone reductase-like Zn-dependent oxidoreductase
MMKAIKLQSNLGLDTITIGQLPHPGKPKSNEVLVRVKASSLNFHDYAVVMGWMSTGPGRIPLADGAGVVEEIGADVTDLQVGDNVVSCFSPYWQDGEPTIAGFSHTPGDGLDGFAREYVVMPASWFTKAPKGYGHDQAATLPTAGVTAWRALAEGKIKAGDTVLVQGTGGVSIFALQLAKAAGARVIATSSSDQKIEKLRALGADLTINYKQHPEWSKPVLDWTEGRGVDHVIEVGGPATLEQSTLACRVGGHICLIGVLTGFTGEMPLGRILQKQIRMEGVTVGSRRHQLDLIKALESTGLSPVIDSHFDLDNLAAAFRHEAAGAHFGKICIDI